MTGSPLLALVRDVADAHVETVEPARRTFSGLSARPDDIDPALVEIDRAPLGTA